VIYGFLRQSTPERPEQAGAESVLVVLNFSGGEEQDCTFALSESELMPGVYEALDLLTDATFSALTVEEGGAFHDYLPLDRVAPQQGYVLLLMKTEP
jgi:hypothetical protein